MSTRGKTERGGLWSRPGRVCVFTLAATSIWCLLAEFYNLCSMRAFTLSVSLPATVLLVVLALTVRSKVTSRTRRDT